MTVTISAFLCGHHSSQVSSSVHGPLVENALLSFFIIFIKLYIEFIGNYIAAFGTYIMCIFYKLYDHDDF
jgi:hypothetical protein